MNSRRLTNGSGYIDVDLFGKGQYAFVKRTGVVAVAEHEEKKDLLVFPFPSGRAVNNRGADAMGQIWLGVLGGDVRYILRESFAASNMWERVMEVSARAPGVSVLQVLDLDGQPVSECHMEVMIPTGSSSLP